MLYIAGGSDLASPWESAELTGNFAVGDAVGMRRGVVAFRMYDPPYRPMGEPCRNSAVLPLNCPMTIPRGVMTAAHYTFFLADARCAYQT